MPEYEDEKDYDTKTGNFSNVSGDGTTTADSDLIVVEVEHKAQLSSLRFTGANVEILNVVIREQDAANPTVVKTFVGSDLDEGDFRDPVIRNIGAQKQVALRNQEQLADANYGLNIEVDEERRGATSQ